MKSSLRIISKIVDYLTLVVPLVIFGWKFLPDVVPAVEVFFVNQTGRLLTGLFFLPFWYFSQVMSPKVNWMRSAGGIVSALLILDVLSFSGGSVKKPVDTDNLKSFTIYSHNVLYLNDSPETVIHNVEEYSPDIVVLQEVNQNMCRNITSKLMEMGYNHSPCLTASPNPSLGFSIYSRFPVRNTEVINTTGVDWSPVWPAQSLEFLVDGFWIRCINVHIMPHHHGTSGSILPRPMQEALAKQQLEEFEEFSLKDLRPTLICGDFNHTPTEKLFNALDPGFIDSWRQGGRGFGFSWNSKMPLFRIDYIFHTLGLVCESIETVPNNFSDHSGLFARIALMPAVKVIR